MRGLLFSAVIVGAAWVGLTPAIATPLSVSGFSGRSVIITQVEKVGYWRRQYRRYGYPAPYVYYPPAYGYYTPPVVYAYPPVVYGYQPPPPAYAYSPPVYGHGASPPVYGQEAPPPAASPSGEEDYGDYPPVDGDYPATEGGYAEYPANGQ
jgi:hypothetical protein